MGDTAVPMYNFKNSFFRINLTACKICDTLWFEGNLKNLIHDSVEFVRTFLQNGINTGNWFDSAQDRDYWRALLNAALNLRVP